MCVRVCCLCVCMCMRFTGVSHTQVVNFYWSDWIVLIWWYSVFFSVTDERKILKFNSNWILLVPVAFYDQCFFFVWKNRKKNKINSNSCYCSSQWWSFCAYIIILSLSLLSSWSSSWFKSNYYSLNNGNERFFFVFCFSFSYF